MIGKMAGDIEALAGNASRVKAGAETLSTTMAPETWAAAGLDAPEAVTRHRMLDMRVAAGAVRDGADVAARPEGPLDLSRLTPADLAFLARDWRLLARPEQ
ncbi:DNA-packaging protein, partial [Rhizobium sp. CRIBSB]|nr:DNA-packaging protein [Rhizobium sp. CRIBSB]